MRFQRFEPACRLFIVLAAVTLLAVPITGTARQIDSSVDVLSEDGKFTLTYTATFSESDLVFGKMHGYDTVRLKDGSCVTTPGSPELPMKQMSFALPEGMKVTGVTVSGTETTRIHGSYDIFPAQPPRRVSGKSTDELLVKPDPSIYGADKSYPAAQAEFSHQSDLAGQAVATVRVFPVSSNPVTGKLNFHRTVTLVIEGVEGYVCGDYLSSSISENGRKMYSNMLAAMVVNAGDINLRHARTARLGDRGVGAGNYDYVIITSTSWEDDFEPLADWKTQKGVPATIVTTDWIYNQGGYSGDNQAKIRAFVIDASSTWGAVYFLLGGDTGTIPYHSKYLLGEWVPNDTYYGDYDADYVCEVHVGRASVISTSQISTFIDKVLVYEKNPPSSNYAKTAVALGFDLWGGGSKEGEDCKKDIYNYYYPSGWTERTEYDSEGGSHKNDSISYLNQGNNLANHIDHCGEYIIGVGYVNHGGTLGNSDMDNLYNGDRQTIFYSIGCWPLAFDYGACIAEHFVRNSGGGGVAFIGNTRYGWYSPFNDDYYSLRYDRYFFRSLFDQGHYNLGACFSDHKNDGYQNDNTYKYIFYELTLLGDPELPILTENPSSLTVTHDGTLNAGEYTSFPVEVRSGGSVVSNAVVCLWKEGDVYETATTNGSGIATFGFTPQFTGTMLVTATRRNYYPSETSAEVLGGGDPLVFGAVDPGVAGQDNTFEVTGAEPGETVYFIYGFDYGFTNEVPGCSGVYAGIENPKVFGNTAADGSGAATLDAFVPAGAQGMTILFQGVELSSCRVSNIVAETFE